MSAVAVLACTFLSLAPTEADLSAPQNPVVTQEAETNFAPGEAALRARINPETGQVEVTSVPAAGSSTQLALDPATANALRRDDEGLKKVFHADGSVSIDLQGRFQSVSVMRIDGNGRRVICTNNAEHACDMLHGAKHPAPQTPEVQ
jgi:hypothetical protein